MSRSAAKQRSSVDHSVVNKVMVIVLTFGVIALLLQAMIYLQGSIHDGVRAYVRGEGLWAKAQKDAVLYLDRYSRSHAESDYQAFRNAVLVNLGDKQARLALSATPVDAAGAREGFLRGGNHPEDIDSLIWFYRNFQFVSYMREAIDIWARGDLKIGELILTGEAMHAEFLDHGGRPEQMARLREQLQQLNHQLLELENRFSLTLGEGARWVRSSLWQASLALLFVVLGFGVFVSRQIIRSIGGSEEQLRLAATVFASSTDGILITDPDLEIISVNQAFCSMTGWSEAEMLGKTPRMFRSGHTSVERYREMWTALKDAGSWQGDIIDRTRGGALLPVRISISGVKGARGQLTHYVSIMTDISERKAQEDQLRYLAHHDALTGLPNRVLFNDRIEQAIKNALRRDTKFALLYFDLDEFKPVNDRFGHEIGDKLLQRVAERLSENIRSTDTVTRRGGDEFAMLLVDVEGRRHGEDVLAKIVDCVCAPCEIDGHAIEFGVSVGMGLFPDDGADPAALMRHADRAMYNMKRSGGGRRSSPTMAAPGWTEKPTPAACDRPAGC